MAKKIRFPLKMKDGTAVRRIEELREHFDLESMLGYFADGKLQIWLANNYYDEMVQKVMALSSDLPDLNARLCEILGVDYSEQEDDIDFEALQRQNEKLRVLREVTDDQQILDNVDAVAFDQDELFEILNNPPVKIYLYGDRFLIPFDKKNISYVGINNPLIILEKDRFLSEYVNDDVTFNSVQYEDGINIYAIKGEQEFLHGDLFTAFQMIKQSAENNNPRAMYIMACFYDQGYGVVDPDDTVRNEWCIKAVNYHEPLSTYGYIKWCIPKGDDKTSHYREIADEIKEMAEAGDVLAQGIFAEMLRSGFGVERDAKQSVLLFSKAAEKGDARSQYSLGLMYKMGIGAERDLESAIACFEIAADKNYKSALQELKKLGI